MGLKRSSKWSFYTHIKHFVSTYIDYSEQIFIDSLAWPQNDFLSSQPGGIVVRAGTIVNFCTLPEPIRLQDSENFSSSRAEKKK